MIVIRLTRTHLWILSVLVLLQVLGILLTLHGAQTACQSNLYAHDHVYAVGGVLIAVVQPLGWVTMLAAIFGSAFLTSLILVPLIQTLRQR